MSDASTPNARRCTMCALSFPPEEEWKTCAQCGEPTDPIGNAKPNVTEEEATSILRHREFDEYLEKEEGKK